jgi:hypothetical protein|tara:strand:+ start:1287 stop:1520 length:234 start_codon:yes stop_codon:yes gene_type:complete
MIPFYIKASVDKSYALLNKRLNLRHRRWDELDRQSDVIIDTIDMNDPEFDNKMQEVTRIENEMDVILSEIKTLTQQL